MLKLKSVKLFAISIVTVAFFSLVSCDQINGEKSNDNDTVSNLIALLALQQANTEAPLSSLTFSKTSYLYYRNVAITKNTPTVVGTVKSCSSSPSLPAGLSIEATTCSISGTPTSIQGYISHTITASDSINNKTVTLSIKVKNSAICGDGEIDTNETCDDGNAINGDGCNNTCTGA